MIEMTYAERVHPPVNPAPACKCSDCILNPVSSHGIYMIGAYESPVMLSRRRSTPERAHLSWRYRFASGCEGGTSIYVPESLDNGDERVWII